MRLSAALVALVALLPGLPLVSGCASSSANDRADATAGDGGTVVDSPPGDAPSFGDASTATVTSLAVSPSTTTLVVTDPASLPTLTLQAIATFSDHTTSPVNASWTVDRLDIAGVSPGTGVVTPSGTTFGVATFTATAGGQQATGTVNVSLKTTLNPGNLSQADQAALDGATTSDPGVTGFAYPYDATVFPRGLLPPEQMWNGGAAGNEYSMHYTGPSFDLTVYLKADPKPSTNTAGTGGSRFTLPVASWNTLTSTVRAANVAVELHRLAGGAAYKSATQSWYVADANLRGSIYYWSISEGQVYVLDVAAGTRSPVVDTGPSTVLGSPTPLDPPDAATLARSDAGPWQDDGNGSRCVACHSVSKDGSTLAAIFSATESSGPLGTVNLGSSSITAIGNYGAAGIYDALSPDGSRAVLNLADKTMQLIDTSSGAVVPSALDGQQKLCDPAFSPDGTRFALAANCGPNGYPVEFQNSNLVVYSLGAAAPYFTSPLTLVNTNNVIGDAIAFPSFSPDSQFVFFQKGNFSAAKYSDPNTNALEHGSDDLYVMPVQAGGTPVALANANDPAGVLPADSKHLNYAPTVNPIAEGGYIWVVFTSPRDYGNEIVSPRKSAPKDATYANPKQLWVTAVDANIGAVDPSHPAFWLPGQDITTANMFGFWALSPCEPTTGADGGTSSCTAGFECCTGFCRGADAGSVCVAQPSGCSQTGEKCGSDLDCCNAASGVHCSGGICQLAAPK
jgi:hypothetical protein